MATASDPVLGPIMQILVPVTDVDRAAAWIAFVTDPDRNNIGLMREAPKGLERG